METELKIIKKLHQEVINEFESRNKVSSEPQRSALYAAMNEMVFKFVEKCRDNNIEICGKMTLQFHLIRIDFCVLGRLLKSAAICNRHNICFYRNKAASKQENNIVPPSTVKVDSPARRVPPLGIHVDNSPESPSSTAPTVLHSNGKIFVSLGNGTKVEIDDDTVNIRTMTNGDVFVNKKAITFNSGASKVEVKKGVIKIK